MTTKTAKQSDVLVKYDGNWADEIDLQGFIVMTDLEWKAYKGAMDHVYSERSFEVSVGTNEEVSFANADDYFDSFEVKKLTSEESEMLRKLFKNQISYYDPVSEKEVKLKVAQNGVMAFKYLDEFDLQDEESEDIDE
jgi:hypothetical protein